MATEKETTKDASKKKDGSAESEVKKSPPKKRTAKSKQTTQKAEPKAAKSAAQKTRTTKSKKTKAAKSATPTTAAKKRGKTKTAEKDPSVPKSATAAAVVSETTAEPPADAGAKTTAPPTETKAPETTTGDAEKAAAPDVQKASPPSPKATTSAPPVPVSAPPSKAEASDKSDTASDRPQPPPPPPGLSAPDGDRPISVLFYLGLGLALVISLIVFTSLFNMSHYYLKSADGALEIWRGKFSPKGIERLLIMPGVKPPEEIKPVYQKEDVYPIAFQYYIDKADTLMGVAGLPDFSGIKSDLNQARSYALNEAQRQMVKNRLNRIELTVLLYKADVAAGKGTLADLRKAKRYLQQAAQLNPDEFEARLIDQKLASIDALMAALRQPAAESAPPEAETSTGIDVSSDEVPSQPPPQPETAVAPESPAAHSEESQ